jgi:hypothetical protein
MQIKADLSLKSGRPHHPAMIQYLRICLIQGRNDRSILSSSTTKRVLLYRFDRQPTEGAVNPHSYLLPDRLEMITKTGNLLSASFQEVKALCFASETDKHDLFTVHNFFERRPKVPGLWTRFTFRDSDQLDGILSHNLLEWPITGFSITPPKAGLSRQRVFIPRQAVIETELRGVVGRSSGAGIRHVRRESVPAENQLTIFGS